MVIGWVYVCNLNFPRYPHANYDFVFYICGHEKAAAAREKEKKN